MADLRDIKPSITELTWEQQLAIHQAIGESRRTPKVKTKTKKQRKSVLGSIINKMNADELLELQRKLENQTKL